MPPPVSPYVPARVQWRLDGPQWRLDGQSPAPATRYRRPTKANACSASARETGGTPSRSASRAMFSMAVRLGTRLSSWNVADHAPPHAGQLPSAEAVQATATDSHQAICRTVENRRPN